MVKFKKNSNPIIRAPGQRSIPSTLLFRPPENRSNVGLETRKGESNVSLTSFLNRKLNASPIHKVKKETLIQLDDNGAKTLNDTRQHHSFAKPREGRTCAIEESVFKMFNNSEEKVRKGSSECLTAPSTSHGDLVKKDAQKHLLVLGDDPKPKRRAYRKVSNGKDNSRPIYNHYENGTGWWNSEREGVDNDEVGHKEVWEGVGSTTLGAIGGLDWS